MQALPNPDPSDTGEWDKKLPKESDIHVDDAFEKERLEFRIQAQEWAGLEKNPKAELFVFVGRWSMQKGIDLVSSSASALFTTQANSEPDRRRISSNPGVESRRPAHNRGARDRLIWQICGSEVRPHDEDVPFEGLFEAGIHSVTTFHLLWSGVRTDTFP